MFKKIMFLLSLAILISIPIFVFAQPVFTVPSPIAGNLQQVINIILQVVFGFAGLVALIFLIIGGYKYITSQGNPEAIEGAKSTIVNSIIGLVIIMAAALIINYVFTALNIARPFQFRMTTPEETRATPTPTREETGLPEPATTDTGGSPAPRPNQSPALYV